MFELPTIVEGAITVALAVFSIVRATEWWQERKSIKIVLAFEAIRAAVEIIYHRFVEGKDSLTIEDKATARELAKVEAEKIGRNSGISVKEVLGEEKLDLYISEAVKDAKCSTKAM